MVLIWTVEATVQNVLKSIKNDRGKGTVEMV